MSEKKATKYIALCGFAVKGKTTLIGTECPKFDSDLTRQLVEMKRMAPADSEEAIAVVKTLTERDKRAAADKKAAEKAARLPGS